MAEFSVELTRVVAASRERVYRAFLDPATLQRWMCPHDHAVGHAEVDERAGGRHRVEFLDGDGGRHAFDSVIRELVPGERIDLDFTFEGPEPHMREDTRLTVTLADVDGGTEVRLVQERITLAPPFDQRSVNTGWSQALAKLAALYDGS